MAAANASGPGEHKWHSVAASVAICVRVHIAASHVHVHTVLNEDGDTWMTIYLAALFIGVIAGLRAMTAPAAVSWAAHFGVLKLGGTWLAILGYTYAPWILTVAAIAELVTDQLPKTPSRKVPVAFAGRIVSGALSGAAVGTAAGSWPSGAVAGAVGAIVGTLGGAAVRARLASAFHQDRPAAFLEDAVAVGGAVLILVLLG
jgi:uncharacterized membrane protein